MSRVTGLLRVVVIGAVLGPTFFANTFLSTNMVPNLTYSVVAGPVLGMVVVPALVRSRLRDGSGASGQLLGRLSAVLLLGSAALALALAVSGPLLAWTLTLGVPEPDRTRALGLAVLLTLFVAPQVPLYTLAALGAAAQQARGRFALAAAAPAAENIGLIGTMVVVALVYPAGLEVADVPIGMVVALGFGATAAVALHAALQVAGAARVGLRLTPLRGWRTDRDTRAVTGRLRRSVSVAVFPAIAFYVLLALSAFEPGGALIIQMAYAVYAVCAALGARAVITAVMPRLSAAASDGDVGRYARSWREALTFATIGGLPALFLLAALADPVAGLLAYGELSTDALVSALAGCIAVLAVAQLAAGVHEVGRQALFARLDVRGPQLAGALSLVVTVLVGVTAVSSLAGSARMIGIAVAVLAADVVAAVTVVARVRRAIRPHPALDVAGTVDVVVAMLAALPLILMTAWLTHPGGGRLRDLVVMAPSTALTVVTYALVLVLLRRRRHGPCADTRAGAPPGTTPTEVRS